jgi:hypothetical protein
MKNRLYRVSLGAGAGVFLALSTIAGETASPTVVVTDASSAPAKAALPASQPAAPAQQLYGVGDVLRLSHAQVGEDVIVAYVHNSGTTYNLSPQDIVYLHKEGVSDKVISAMLAQHSAPVVQHPASVAPQWTPAAQHTAPPVSPATSAAAPAPSNVQSGHSTVYVASSPPVTYTYQPYYYPAYYPAYAPASPSGSWWPPVALSFGFVFGGHGHHH